MHEINLNYTKWMNELKGKRVHIYNKRTLCLPNKMLN